MSLIYYNNIYIKKSKEEIKTLFESNKLIIDDNLGNTELI
jgi:hypothetical protein